MPLHRKNTFSGAGAAVPLRPGPGEEAGAGRVVTELEVLQQALAQGGQSGKALAFVKGAGHDRGKNATQTPEAQVGRTGKDKLFGRSGVPEERKRTKRRTG